MLRLRSIDSTQDLARRMARAGAPEWSLVAAGKQARGRGRLGRRWESGPGGLYLSLILRPPIGPKALARLSVLSADAVARAVTRLTGLKTAVKYPNDVMASRGVAWKKVAGILIEASGGERRTDWVVVGVGVNVNNRLPRSLPRAASLAGLAGRRLRLERIERAVLGRLRRAYAGLVEVAKNGIKK